MKATLHLLRIATIALLSVSALLQTHAQEAFYIYQNDGHFNGFFYDEVEQISYSKLDTLNVEHDVYVSQEIVTADSTYRIMLSAIDSVGFVQPEIIYNPQFRHMANEGLAQALLYYDGGNTLSFFEDRLPKDKPLKVGDILYLPEGYIDGVDEICLRVTSVESDGWWFTNVTTEEANISDISDIFHQFITVEEFSKDRNGQLVKRRVAGMPDMEVGNLAKPRKGEFSGTLLSFNINSHIPIKDGITLDPSIEGAIRVKAEWNLSIGRTKYIGITNTLDFGLGLGVTLHDATLSDVFVGGASDATAIPLPAACPLFEVVLGPDMFIRGEAKATISLASPKYKGSVWTKLEFIDWRPSMSVGWGSPNEEEDEGDEGDEDDESDDNLAEAKMEFTGYLQTGVQFPFRLQTHKLLRKWFEAETDLTFYVGPKFSASLSVDLRNIVLGDNTTYGNLKNSKVTLSPLTADYEAKATTTGLWGSKEEFTLLDGSVSLLGNIDFNLFPDFDNWRVSDTEFSVQPSGLTFCPWKVGIKAVPFELDDNSEDVATCPTQWANMPYWWTTKPQWLDGRGKLTFNKAGLRASIDRAVEQNPFGISGKFWLYPVIDVFGKEILANEHAYEYESNPSFRFKDAKTDFKLFNWDDRGGQYLCKTEGDAWSVGLSLKSKNADDLPLSVGDVQDTINVYFTSPNEGIVNREIEATLLATNQILKSHMGEVMDSIQFKITQKPSMKVNEISFDFSGDNMQLSGSPLQNCNYFDYAFHESLDSLTIGHPILHNERQNGEGDNSVTFEYDADLAFDLTSPENKGKVFNGGKYVIKTTYKSTEISQTEEGPVTNYRTEITVYTFDLYPQKADNTMTFHWNQYTCTIKTDMWYNGMHTISETTEVKEGDRPRLSIALR